MADTEVERLQARLDRVNEYVDRVIRPKNVWIALDLRAITSGYRVDLTDPSGGYEPADDTDQQPETD